MKMFDINKARDYRNNYFLKNMDNMTDEQLHQAERQMLANEIELVECTREDILNGIYWRLGSISHASSRARALADQASDLVEALENELKWVMRTYYEE